MVLHVTLASPPKLQERVQLPLNSWIKDTDTLVHFQLAFLAQLVGTIKLMRLKFPYQNS